MSRMPIDLRQLQHLVAVVEHASFSRAAEAEHLTQPALSRSIQALESSVGCLLLHRQRGAIEPTEAGRMLLRHAAAMLASARDLERDLRLARDLELGEVRIGVGPFGGAALIGPVVAALSREHPRVQVRLVVAPWQELPDRARRREVDLVVAELSEIRMLEEFAHRALSRHDTAFVCRSGHPLATLGRPIRPDELFAFPIAAPRLPTEAARRLVEAMPPPLRERARRHGPVTIECDSHALLLQILQESDAVSNLPRFMYAAERRAGTLTELAGIDLGLALQFGAAWLAHRRPEGAAARLVDLLVQQDAARAMESDEAP